MTLRIREDGGFITDIPSKPVDRALPKPKAEGRSIGEAAREACRCAKAIRRTSWPETYRVIPSPKDGLCTIIVEGGTEYPGWEPGFDDLIAQDWEVVERLLPVPSSMMRHCSSYYGEFSHT